MGDFHPFKRHEDNKERDMKATVYSKEGKKKGEVVLNPEIFAARINNRLLELVRNAYSNNLRHGTADTKVRKEIRGGGKKPWKQKGTGRARHGSTRSPIWRGGGTVFGPQPHSFFVNLPKTMRKAALISALSLRGEQKNILLLEDAKLETPKTKEWAGIFNALPLEDKRALCIVKEVDENLERASRNMSQWIDVKRASDLNAYHILQREKIVLEQDAVSVIEVRLLGEASGTSAVAVEEKKEKAPKKRVIKSKAAKSAVRAAKRTKVAVKAKSAASKAKKSAAKKGSKS